ncbi:MAG: hypothetical protein NTV39_01290 [Candidatus Saccharibacteria bacterium]|nr:hypothetical protein [Candidatus Saccharibacteria bacterium]
MDKKLNANGLQLSRQLAEAKAADAVEYNGRTINVAGVGGVVSAAYEQLRNAAEYAQEHLLIQNAIRRFFVRSVSFHNHSLSAKSVAEELIIELTQSGYLKNNTLPTETIDTLGDAINKHYNNYWRLKTAGIDEHVARTWTLDLLSIGSEDILVKNLIQPIYIQFAYHHYNSILNKKSFKSSNPIDDNFEVSLYIAIHRALFKSDLAAVRYDMQKLYNTSDKNINAYAHFHQSIDDLFSSEVTNKITLYVNKYGAPLRIFRNMIQDNNKIDELLTDSVRFDRAYADQIKKEYKKAKQKLNKGLVKSIVFLIITKTLIGVAIEVPYDLITTGALIVTPFVVNLLSPILYLAILRLGFKLPGTTNAKAIRAYADDMLYSAKANPSLYPAFKTKKYPIGFSIAYTLMFLIIFAMVANLLYVLGFNIVNGLIFFIFIAAASFLGFRLSRIVRELELVAVKQGVISTTRELIFAPFTFLGKWISDKYQKVNVVALAMDTFIELPLKTILRLIRQWTKFIDEKTDQF